MDISSTTSSAATMSTADTNASTQAQKASKSDSSFQDEMNKVSSEQETKETTSDKKVESKSKNDKTDGKMTEKGQKSAENVQNQSDIGPNTIENAKNTMENFQNGMNNIQNGEFNQAMMISVTGFQNQLTDNEFSGQNSNIQTLMDANKQLADITSLSSGLQFSAKLDYSSVQMDTNDAKFFADLVQNTDGTLQSLAADLQQGSEAVVQNAQKNVKVSSTLMEALSDAVKNNQSLRIDFDEDVSVVLRVDRDGALSAKFIPADKAVEEYLKQNISYLRQRFDEQELSYNDLSYSREQRQNQQQNRRNNKEKSNE